MEKRASFTRNNVLHLWPYLIEDLRNIGIKKLFGKFCAGSLDHISMWHSWPYKVDTLFVVQHDQRPTLLYRNKPRMEYYNFFHSKPIGTAWKCLTTIFMERPNIIVNTLYSIHNTLYIIIMIYYCFYIYYILHLSSIYRLLWLSKMYANFDVTSFYVESTVWLHKNISICKSDRYLSSYFVSLSLYLSIYLSIFRSLTHSHSLFLPQSLCLSLSLSFSLSFSLNLSVLLSTSNSSVGRNF